MERLPRYFVLCGPTQSGKTTFAKKFASLTGAVHIGGDQILEERRITKQKFQQRPEQIGTIVMFEIKRRIKDMLLQNIDVINEGPHATPEWREEAKKIAGDISVRALIIYVKVDEEERRRRWEASTDSPYKAKLSPEKYKEFGEAFVPPSADEEHVVFRSGIDTVPEWMKQQAVLLDQT